MIIISRKLALSISLLMIMNTSIPVYADETTDAPVTTESASESETATEESFKPNYNNHGGITMTYNEFMDQIGNNKDSFQKVDNDMMFNLMKNSVDAGEDISLGQAFSMTEGLEIPSNFIYDISETGLTGHVDATDINLQYASLVSNMNDQAKELNLDMSKNTVGAVKYFNNTYGDIADELMIKEKKLPENFSFVNVVQNSSSQMASAYKDLYNDSNYKDISSRINVAALFDEAAKGLTQPSLVSLENLQSLIKPYKMNLYGNMMSNMSANKSGLYGQFTSGVSGMNENPEYDLTDEINAQNDMRNQTIDLTYEKQIEKETKKPITNFFKNIFTGIQTGAGALVKGYSKYWKWASGGDEETAEKIDGFGEELWNDAEDNYYDKDAAMGDPDKYKYKMDPRR